MFRIQLILMWIRILDPHWKKMNPHPDPGYFFQIYWIFLNKAEFSNFVDFFSLIFMLKLDEPFRNKEIFIISLFFNSSDLGFEIKIFFCSFGWYFAPWIWIRIQEAKILRIQRIRILSTAMKSPPWIWKILFILR